VSSESVKKKRAKGPPKTKSETQGKKKNVADEGWGKTVTRMTEIISGRGEKNIKRRHGTKKKTMTPGKKREKEEVKEKPQKWKSKRSMKKKGLLEGRRDR